MHLSVTLRPAEKESAKAYAEITGAYINATHPETERVADAEMSRWEAKFDEWEGK
jgi:hypothetical protein